MPSWEPLTFLAFLLTLIVLYEIWASSRKGLTITEASRKLAEHARWIAVLMVILTLSFLMHCFGKALGVTG
mgnify:CR=1 FL=1